MSEGDFVLQYFGGHFVQGGFCPGGVLSGGDFVQGVLCPGFMPERLLRWTRLALLQDVVMGGQKS